VQVWGAPQTQAGTVTCSPRAAVIVPSCPTTRAVAVVVEAVANSGEKVMAREADLEMPKSTMSTSQSLSRSARGRPTLLTGTPGACCADVGAVGHTVVVLIGGVGGRRPQGHRERPINQVPGFCVHCIGFHPTSLAKCGTAASACADAHHCSTRLAAKSKRMNILLFYGCAPIPIWPRVAGAANPVYSASID